MIYISIPFKQKQGMVALSANPKSLIALLFLIVVSGKLFSQTSYTYSYTGAAQTLTLTSGGAVQIETWGAQGGANWANNTNYGGYSKAVFSFSIGTVLNIYVGEQPSGITAAFNGGGAGEGAGKAGGGASDVRLTGTALTDRIIVGGGGGGAGYWSSLHVVGGVGGGLTGGDGYRNTTADAGGQGGTQTGSGVGTCGSFNNPSVAGGLGYGGTPSGCGCEGYGGGGGYYGGAGSGNCRGGGGGSGYILSTATNTVFTSGTRTGHGQVVITILLGAVKTQTNVACHGALTGVASVSATGVAGPYTYSWIPSGATTSVATNLSAGSHTCIITAPGSTLSTEFIITEPTALTSSISAQTNASCFSYNNASVSLAVNGGTGAYSYTWTPSVIATYSASALSAGNYSVTIKDANNCSITQTIAITQPPSFSISAVTTSSAICVGSSVTLSGSGASTYSWTNGVTNGSAFAPSQTTTYSLTAANLSGCPASNTFTLAVTVNTLPLVSVNSGSICSGSVFTLVPSGASTYTFSNGSSTVSPGVLTSYSVTGTSAEGCHSSNSAVSTITVLTLPLISVNSGSVCFAQSFTLNASGADTYTYSGGNSVVTPTTTSSFSVTGTDVFGCSSSNTAVATVTVMALPVVSVTGGAICAGESFTLSSSGALTYTYSGGNDVVSPLTTTSYSVSGTSAEGCHSDVDGIATVTVNAIPVITVNSGSVCAGQSFTMLPTGASTYTFVSGNAIVSPSVTSSYSVTGTSAEGCEAANYAVSTVTVYNLPSITVNSGTICSGESFSITASGALSYTYEGGGSVKSPSITSSYTVSGTSSEGCVSGSPATSTVFVNASPMVSITVSDFICAGETASLMATGADSYLWSGGETSQVIVVSPSLTTSYTLTGTSANGCDASVVSTQSVSECTGIYEKANAPVVLVYPNPTNGVFTIRGNEEMNLTLTNEIGQVIDVLHINLMNGYKVITTNLAGGIYFLSSGAKGQVIHQKLIVTK